MRTHPAHPPWLRAWVVRVGGDVVRPGGTGVVRPGGVG